MVALLCAGPSSACTTLSVDLLARRAALLALAIAAPAASADSIAYVKDGDVWLSMSAARASTSVTTTGGYSDISQADDGTIIGLTACACTVSTARAACSPTSTHRSATPPRPAKTFYGPFDPAISPDGTKVAYTYYYMTQSQSPTSFRRRA